MSRAGPVSRSLRSKCFRGANSEERGFRRFARAKNGARAKRRRNCTETLATQAGLAAGWCQFAAISARLLNAIIINFAVV